MQSLNNYGIISCSST